MNNQMIPLLMQGRMQRRRRGYFVTGIMMIMALLLCCAMLMLGNTIYPLTDVVAVLMGERIQGVTFAVETIRLPRMLAGLLSGFAFGIAGVTFQTMLRNPLANPNVIGITSGSSAAAVFCIIVLNAREWVVSLSSIAAGLLTVLLIYLLSRGTSYSIGRLILVGIGIQAVCNSIITYLMLIGREENLPSAIRWLTGSLNGAQMGELPLLIGSVIVFSPMIVMLGKHLSILELGDLAAASIGVNTDRTRVVLIVSAVIMVAVATSTTGPIAAVAFLAGPIARRLVGSGIAQMIPAGMVGANLVLAADLIGQFAFQVRFPVGVITGIIGAPYLLYLLIRMNRRGDF